MPKQFTPRPIHKNKPSAGIGLKNNLPQILQPESRRPLGGSQRLHQTVMRLSD